MKKNFVINKAVNIEEKIPRIKVRANPLIGPVSKTKRSNEANTVVKLESKIAPKAFLYPASTD
ncbi:Uncharacterised protein [Chlamydia abortus]|nr:Uncharacterised protein [Chlamydia abortus]